MADSAEVPAVGCWPVRVARGRNLTAPLAELSEESKGFLTVLRVRPPPTQCPVHNLLTTMAVQSCILNQVVGS